METILMHLRRIAVGLAVFLSVGACSDTPSAPTRLYADRAQFFEGNPPPPPISLLLSYSCPDINGCTDIPCPLGDGDCFIVRGLDGTLFVNPASTYGAMEIESVPNVAVSDGAALRETARGLTVKGTLRVFYKGDWLSIDMQSMHGSMLFVDPNGRRSVVVEADAYLPNGQRYPRQFVYYLPIF
jgi:hypothetical protein